MHLKELKYWRISTSRRIQATLKALAGFVCAIWILQPLQAQAPTDLRVALVIGNAAYAGNAALPNPTNDAAAMSEALRGLGFTVVQVKDASREQMVQAITQVQGILNGKKGVGMLYYAGHGLQLDWRNYMLPVDAKISQASDVAKQSLEVSQVIDAFKQAGTRMNIVVLDACRDNPFAGTATGKGLAQLDAPPGTFLAYATAPGNVAEDGTGQNGLYTSFLLQELKKPQAKIEDVFKRVRLNVRQKSDGRQIPWESTSLEDDFFFDSTNKLKTAAGEGQSAYRIQRTLWDSLKESTNSADIIEFMKSFPSGYFSELAQFRLDQINKPKITLVAAQGSTAPLLQPGETPWRVGDSKTWRRVAQEYPGRRVDFINRSLTTKIENGMIHTKEEFDGWGKPTDVVTISDLRGNPTVVPDLKFSATMQYFPAEYRVGYQWRFGLETEGAVGKHFREYTSKITARETITSAIGSVEVYRIETSMQRSDGVQERSTAWISPTMGTIKNVRNLYNSGRLIFSSENTIQSWVRGPA
jgi:hypothetical protein